MGEGVYGVYTPPVTYQDTRPSEKFATTVLKSSHPTFDLQVLGPKKKIPVDRDFDVGSSYIPLTGGHMNKKAKNQVIISLDIKTHSLPNFEYH